MTDIDEPRPPPRWLVGTRRAWVTSRALARWARDRGVTGTVWAPTAYDPEDAAGALASLTSAGAAVDISLLWDTVVGDIRGAADALAAVYRTADRRDGYAAAWLYPDRLRDPDKATAAARQMYVEVRRANVAAAFAWRPERAAVVSAIVALGIPVALAGVRDDAARRAVADAREAGMAKRREEIGEDEEALEIPVFLLGSPDERPDEESWVIGVGLRAELSLFSDHALAAPLPLDPEAERAGWEAAVASIGERVKESVVEDDYAPASFAEGVGRECADLAREDVLGDIWSRDHTTWSDDPTEITDRLGWLDVADRMRAELDDITAFARGVRAGGEIKRVVVCGMGGSSLGVEVLTSLVRGGLPLTVLDTTDPDHVAELTSSLDLERTLFVVSSKSGTTVETLAHLEHFWSLVKDGERFVAITDEGSPLHTLATQRGFRRAFSNPPDIGGRYSILSYFGIVPAAIAGVDVGAVLEGARRAMSANGPAVAAPSSPAMRLAAAVGGAVDKEGRDKLTLVLSPGLEPYGDWLEQLVAESTGKRGSGVVPVVGEPLGAPEVYGSDRLFCVYPNGADLPEELMAEHPAVRIGLPGGGGPGGARALGRELFRWELATAVLGYMLDVNPFDQPDVESTKRRTREIVEGGGGSRPDPGSAPDLLSTLGPPGYIGIQAFLPPTDEHRRRLEAVRARLRDRYHVAVTVGFGPRFLHSTGQLHKGGPSTGVFLQVTGEHGTDVEIPGSGYTFGRLIDAQADADLDALREAGRAAARLTLPELEKLGVA